MEEIYLHYVLGKLYWNVPSTTTTEKTLHIDDGAHRTNDQASEASTHPSIRLNVMSLKGPLRRHRRQDSANQG